MRPSVRRLVSFVICVIAILGGVPGLAAPPPGYEGHCWFACNVAVKPWGTWAEFDISVPPHKALILEASLVPPRPDGTWAQGTGTVATFQLGTAQTWKTHLTGLFPDSHYYYVVRLERDGGHQTFRVGSFWTRRRQVEVKFDKIHVIDDSDWGAKGAGDFTFGFWVGPKWLGEWSRQLDSGDDFPLPKAASAIHLFASGNVETVALTVMGLENDDFDGPAVIEPGQWTAFWVDALQHGPFDRADAKKNLFVGPNTPTESQCNVNECPIEAQQFSMKSAPPTKGDVAFEVVGRYWVSYQPTGKAPQSVAQWVPKTPPTNQSESASPSQSVPATPKKKTIDMSKAAPALPKGTSEASKAGEGGSVGRAPAQGPQVAARPPVEVSNPQVAQLRTDLGQLTHDLEGLGQGSQAVQLRQRVQALQARLDRGSLDPRALQELRQQTDTLRRQVDGLRSSPLPKP